MVHLVGAERVRVETPTRVVLDAVSLGLDSGDRIGVVGDRRTGHDPDGMARAKRPRCARSSGDRTAQRQTAWRPREVNRTDGEAVHLRHDGVEQQQRVWLAGGGGAAKLGQRRPPAVHGRWPRAPVPQRLPQHVAVGRVVVHHQHAPGGARRLGRFPFA